MEKVITEMVWTECGKCGVSFGFSEEYRRRRQSDHRTFYCPNGHPRCYAGKTESEKKIARLEGQVCNLKRTSADLRERQEALPGDIRDAQWRAKLYSGRAQRGAFWRGWDDRLCGREAACCPYTANRASGFRAAWFDGFGAERETIDV